MQRNISIPLCLLGAVATIAACSSGEPTSTHAWPPGEGTHLSAEALTLTSPPAIAPGPPLSLLASVATKTGSTFEFYDDGNGNVLYSEFGGKDVVPIHVNPKGLTPSQVWARVAPGVAVPKAITDAEALAAASGAANANSASSGMPTAVGAQRGMGPTSPPAGPHTLNVSSPPPGDPNQFCSGAWAYNNLDDFSEFCDGDQQYNWCWYDTGPGGSDNSTDIDMDGVSICNANSSSDVFLNVNRSNGQGGASWSIPSSSWRWYVHAGGLCCLGLCYCHYNATITNPGSWGDLQFAGGISW